MKIQIEIWNLSALRQPHMTKDSTKWFIYPEFQESRLLFFLKGLINFVGSMKRFIKVNIKMWKLQSSSFSQFSTTRLTKGIRLNLKSNS